MAHMHFAGFRRKGHFHSGILGICESLANLGSHCGEGRNFQVWCGNRTIPAYGLIAGLKAISHNGGRCFWLLNHVTEDSFI